MHKSYKIAIILKKISLSTVSGIVISKKYNKKYKITETKAKKYLLQNTFSNINVGDIVKIKQISRVSKKKAWEICFIY